MTHAERNLLMLVAQAYITERAGCHPQPGSLWDQIHSALAALRAELEHDRQKQQAALDALVSQSQATYEWVEALRKLTTMGDVG